MNESNLISINYAPKDQNHSQFWFSILHFTVAIGNWQQHPSYV